MIHHSPHMSELRKLLLKQALNHIPFDGWTEKSLLSAALDLGIEPAAALNAFPGRGTEMIALHSEMADEMMIEDFRALGDTSSRTSEKVQVMIQLRLQRWEINREAIRSGAGLLMSPGNLSLATRLLYRTVDMIWRELGDHSTDFNFYTKRASLAAIYSATLFYWLDDHSEGHWNTWRFLERSLARLGQLPRWKAKTRSWRRYVPDPLLFINALRKRSVRPLRRVRG